MVEFNFFEATRRAPANLNHKSKSDQLVSKALEVDIFQAKRVLPVSICCEGAKI
ncbi:hypothetical protein EMIT0232MI5_150100 [Pseudomonas sp. IT-232MI5]